MKRNIRFSYESRISSKLDTKDTIQALKVPWSRIHTGSGKFHYHIWVHPDLDEECREALFRMFRRAAYYEGGAELFSWDEIPESVAQKSQQFITKRTKGPMLDMSIA